MKRNLFFPTGSQFAVK